MGCCGVCHFLVAGAKMIGNSGVDTDSKTDGNGIYKILYRINQGERRHGIFADLCDKEAVHNVI